jgi:hypothetical protein
MVIFHDWQVCLKQLMDKWPLKDKQKLDDSMSGHAIQTIANLFQELMEAERFFHEVGVVAQGRVFA